MTDAYLRETVLARKREDCSTRSSRGAAALPSSILNRAWRGRAGKVTVIKPVLPECPSDELVALNEARAALGLPPVADIIINDTHPRNNSAYYAPARAGSSRYSVNTADAHGIKSYRAD